MFNLKHDVLPRIAAFDQEHDVLPRIAAFDQVTLRRMINMAPDIWKQASSYAGVPVS
jgi:hypothetical protein